MVNKKLSLEDEHEIYMQYLSGKPLYIIAKDFPVVPSTIQRVIKKMSITDGSKRNLLLTKIFKNFKSVNTPLEISLKMFDENKNCEELHYKQKELLLESLAEISQKIEQLSNVISQLKI